jgi:hypothetical protein
MYLPFFQQMKKQLGQLDKWLAAAIAFADTRKFESKNFVGLRLAVDQFDFAKQVQATCDVAKLAAARLSGKDAPTHEDNEQTLEQLRTRVASVISYLDGYAAKDFEGAATRTITQARWKGETMVGADYFLEHALPNFYFHLTTTYAILRHAGVPVGKSDFLGALTKHPPK